MTIIKGEKNVGLKTPLLQSGKSFHHSIFVYETTSSVRHGLANTHTFEQHEEIDFWILVLFQP